MRRALMLISSLAVAACKSSTAPPAPTQVAFIVQPSNTTAGHVIGPSIQVAIEDAAGNTATTAHGNVTLVLASNPSHGALSGTATVSTQHGVATFPSVLLDRAGSNYMLTATTSSFPSVTSKPFSVMPGMPAQLAFTTQPSTVPAGEPMAPPVQVAVLDSESNVVTGFTGQVTLGLGANPGGATLTGTLAGVAIAGVATFPNLVVSTQDTGYTLAAGSGTLSAASNTFTVGTTGIQYHGGPVIYMPKVAALYWSHTVIYNGGPPPGTHGSPVGADQSIVGFFFNNIGGSPYYNINATYFDAAGTSVQNVATYTQYWADSVAPTSAAPTDVDIATEIENGLTNGALTYDESTLYAVFTGTGVNLGGGFGTQYCAYHSYFIDALGRNVKYAAMPYANDYIITSTAAGCSEVHFAGSPNNDAPADAEINLLAHEWAETITDENGTAWWVTTTGEEMADLCAWNFGNVYVANGAYANQSLGGKNFLMQMLWVNAETPLGAPVGCQQSWTASARPGTRAPHALIASWPVAAPKRHVMHMQKNGPGWP